MRSWKPRVSVGRQASTFFGLLALGLVAGASASAIRSQESETPTQKLEAHASGMWAAPRTLESLLSRSDIVVVGTFSGAKTDAQSPIPGRDEAIAQRQVPSFADRTVPISFFEFAIEQYVRGQGDRAIQIRQLGDDAIRAASSEYPGPVAGQRVLLFLVESAELPGSFAVVYGPWGRLVDRAGGGIEVMATRAAVPFPADETSIDALGARIRNSP